MLKNRRPGIRTIIILFFVLLLLAFVSIYAADFTIANAAKGKMYSAIESIPFNKVGVLLGTGKYLPNGEENYFYKFRIDAARDLIKAGKIRYLVISGDNSRKDYNEPQTMKDDLVHEGIDSNIIYLDYAGFRTFDSMVRLREIFSQTSVTVISQRFHNERAIYIGRKENIEAIGFNARDVGGEPGLHVQFREKLARVKVFVDYLFNKKPRFLGPKVSIPG
jgi:SanA protein